MLKSISKSLHLIVVLQQEHVILLAHYDCQPFPPSMKSSDFGVFTLFVILDNFRDFFRIFEHLQSQDGVISVDNCYKVN